MKRLNEKVAVITGASQGIGLAMAKAFAHEGASMVISSRRQDAIDNAAEQIRRQGANVLAVQADTAKRADAQKTIDAAIAEFGRLDVLVNNAQATRQNNIEDITDEAIELTFGSGLFGTLYHMQAAFPHLKKNGGSIINYGTRQGIYGEPGDGIYGANKEGVRALSRSAAREWGKYNIRVNVINPAALSPAAARFFEENPERGAEYMRAISLGRFGDPESDIAPIAVFLASDDSRYLTGQTLNADGGQVML